MVVTILVAELMLLGFISLLLTVSQTYVAKICISESLSESMLPCRKQVNDTTTSSEEKNRKLSEESQRRVLASSSGSSCFDKVNPYVLIILAAFPDFLIVSL